MNTNEIDELERLLAEAPMLRLGFDDGITDDTTVPPLQDKPAAIYGPGGEWIADFDCEMLAKVDSDAIGRLLVALNNAAPALIEAAREVERLRAFVPRWQSKPYGDHLTVWHLYLGVSAHPDTGIEVYSNGNVWGPRDAEQHPDLPTAARAVCTRLGIPYVPVETT